MSINTVSIRPTLPDGAPVTVREADASDRTRLARLAQLDSASVPDGTLVVAEVEGEMRAAVAVGSGMTIADPFHRTAELVALARTRADQIRARNAGGLRIVARTPADAGAGRLRRVAA